MRGAHLVLDKKESESRLRVGHSFYTTVSPIIATSERATVHPHGIVAERAARRYTRCTPVTLAIVFFHVRGCLCRVPRHLAGPGHRISKQKTIATKLDFFCQFFFSSTPLALLNCVYEDRHYDKIVRASIV